MKKQKAKPSVRLPRHVLPERYAITLKPDLESFTFSGQEAINVVIEKSDKLLTLHSVDLKILSAEFVHAKRGTWSSKITYNVKAETAVLRFTRPLPKGKGVLRLVFQGILNDKLKGYYRSSFTHEGKQKYLATTQFEATDARRAFPCFDEPDMKAVFEVSLIVPSHHEVVSNTLPATIKEHEAGYKVVRFKPTPKMSTYLLAFVSGELEFIQKKSRSGVLVRVFTTPGKKKQANFALETATKVIDFFQKYFQTKYPLPTLDLLAIPDFMSGAMENWGAVTFRETALLVDEQASSLTTKQWVALVIAHEIAHQWFGNLVTMDWWTHLWLNEGFASYMEYVAVDALYPNWNIWNQFMLLEYARGMGKDQYASTHPIEVEVHHPNEIDEIFDDISYRKGSSVIRMLAAYIGAETFRTGLVQYIKQHSYKNATTQDLWKALEKVSGQPVQTLMRTWTEQPGFPIVGVSSTDTGFSITQERFYIHPGKAKKTVEVQTWQIPVSYESAKGAANQFLLQERVAGFNVEQYRKLNLKEAGFFRVNYTEKDLKDLAPRIAKKELGVLDRWGILSTSFALAESGRLATPAVLELLGSYKKETEYIVMSEAVTGLLRLGSFYRKEKWYGAFEEFARSIIAPSAKRLGFEKKEGESHEDVLLRELVIRAFGYFGHEDTIVWALRQLRSTFREGVNAIDSDYRLAVYYLVGQAGGLPEFQYFKKLYINESSPEERQRLAEGMASFVSPGILSKALTFSLSEHVRSQDAWRFYKMAGQNPAVHEVLWSI
jgi:puromycin-sensitive aminopeptidase